MSYLRHTLHLALLLSEWVMQPDTLKKDLLWANLLQGRSQLLLLPGSLFSHSLRAFWANHLVASLKGRY